jgi:hypothetical protein
MGCTDIGLQLAACSGVCPGVRQIPTITATRGLYPVKSVTVLPHTSQHLLSRLQGLHPVTIAPPLVLPSAAHELALLLPCFRRASPVARAAVRCSRCWLPAARAAARCSRYREPALLLPPIITPRCTACRNTGDRNASQSLWRLTVAPDWGLGSTR